LSEYRLVKVPTVKPCSGELGAGKIRVLKPRIVKRTTAQVGSFKCRMAEVNAICQTVTKIGLGQILVIEDGMAKKRMREVRPT